jgi:transposase
MNKFASPVAKVNAEVIGLDVHQKVIAWCRLGRRGQRLQAEEIGGDRASFEKFLREEVGRRRPHFALEACGGFEWVYDLLVARFGAERVHLAQPRRVQMIANSSDKNDANDAFWLAYLAFEGRLPEAHLPEKVFRELRIACRERIRAVQTRSDAIRRLRSHLRQMGERLPTRVFLTVQGRAFVEALAARSQGSRAMALREALVQIAHLDQAIERWEAEMERISKDVAGVETLAREIPGVGRVLAATILGETGPVQRFASPKALGRYTGLTPEDRSTGGEQIHGPMTREGSPHLRWALTQAVMHCNLSRHDPHLAVREWVRAKAKKVGRKKALVAGARKMAESIWRLFHWGEAFDATKPFGGPRSASHAARAPLGLEPS